jgi:copper chaperone CopZ
MRLQLQASGIIEPHAGKVIERLVGSLAGVAHVQANLEARTVTVEYDEAQVSADAIKRAIRLLGYQFTDKGE